MPAAWRPAAEPRDRLDVHGRRRAVRARATRRPDDGAARQDAGRLVGHQLHGLRARPSRRLRRLGRGRRQGLGLRRGAALLPQERGPGAERRHRRRRRRAQHRRSAGGLGPGTGAARRAQQFVAAAGRAGSPAATTTAAIAAAPRASSRCCRPPRGTGKRSSTFHAFLEGDAEQRPNLTIVTRRARDAGRSSAEARRSRRARGRVPRRGRRDAGPPSPRKEVVLSAGAVGSPQLLLLSGIGPQDELEALGIACRRRLPARRQAPEGPPAAARSCSRHRASASR